MFEKILILILRFIRKIRDDDIFALSAQFSYYIILGALPFVFMLVSLLGYYAELLFDALKTVENIIPSDIYALILRMTGDSVSFFNSTSYLPVSIITIIWSASSGSVGIIKGINKAYECQQKRNYFFMRLKGILFTFCLIFSLQIAFLFIFVGARFIEFFATIKIVPQMMVTTLNLVSYLFPVALLILIFSFTYKFLPYEKIKFTSVFPGAIFSTLGWIIGSLIFSIYTASRSMFYTNIYGNLSGIFIFIIYVYLTSFIFLLGAEINAFISKEGITFFKR